MDSKEKTKIVPVEAKLTPEAKRVVEGIRADTGVSNVEAVSRILEWFAAQDRRLRLAILNNDPETSSSLLLEWTQMQLAAGKRLGGVDFEQAIGEAKIALERVQQLHVALTAELKSQASRKGR